MAHSCQRINHGGASPLAPANTLEAFDAVLDVGVDMVEFDVRGWRGELVLAHAGLLERALDFLAGFRSDRRDSRSGAARPSRDFRRRAHGAAQPPVERLARTGRWGAPGSTLGRGYGSAPTGE